MAKTERYFLTNGGELTTIHQGNGLLRLRVFQGGKTVEFLIKPEEIEPIVAQLRGGPTSREIEHRTAQDAYHQFMFHGRMGSLAGASDEYLLELERRAHEWIGEMREEMGRRIEASNSHEAMLSEIDDENDQQDEVESLQRPGH
jgi:hypothetical protein